MRRASPTRSRQVVPAVPAGIPAHARAAAALAIRGAYANAMNNVLLVGAIVALAGAVLAVVLVRRSDFVGYAAASQAPEPAAVA